MDYTVFVTIGITMGVILLAMGLKYLKDNNYVSESDLILASRILGIGSDIMIELKPNDKKVVKISEIVKNSIDSIISQYSEFGDMGKLKSEVESMIYNLCNVNQIEMTDSRKKLVNEMVNILLPLAIKSRISD